MECIRIYVQGVQEKLCFFTFHCNPFVPLLLAGNFLYNQYQMSAGEGEVANFREFLNTNNI